MSKPSKTAIATFREYHNTDAASRAYAEEKLRSGTAALTPEAVLFYQGAISERKAREKRIEGLLEKEQRMVDAVNKETQEATISDASEPA